MQQILNILTSTKTDDTKDIHVSHLSQTVILYANIYDGVIKTETMYAMITKHIEQNNLSEEYKKKLYSFTKKFFYFDKESSNCILKDDYCFVKKAALEEGIKEEFENINTSWAERTMQHYSISEYDFKAYLIEFWKTKIEIGGYFEDVQKKHSINDIRRYCGNWIAKKIEEAKKNKEKRKDYVSDTDKIFRHLG